MSRFFIILAIAVSYFVAGEISFLLLQEHSIVTIVIFASEGIALASILFLGSWVWPGIFLGQLSLALFNDLSLLPALEISTINTLEALLGLYLFKKYKLSIKFTKLRDGLGLILIIALVLQPFSAISGNSALLLHAVISSQEFFNSIFSWWFGNVMGQLLFTPFTLLLLQKYRTINIVEFLLYAVGFSLFIYILELELVVKNLSLLLSFTIPVVIFIIAKKGLPYAMLLPILIAMVSNYSVYLGVGAFVTNSTMDNIININFFILVHISLSLISGILFEESREAEANLRERITQEVNKNREQQLLMLQQSRLAQMGEMISMIAHQWRQPLNNLHLVNQFIIGKYSAGTIDQESMEYFKENSKKQINLMSNTIDDFRNFFQPNKEQSLFNVADSIEHILSLTSNIHQKYQIKIEFQAKENLYTSGYPNELAQAILNIINNSKDALLENPQKEQSIKISLSATETLIAIKICDKAGGIDKEIIDKIFDPYFSTKTKKNGTGLGLYMTKMLIQNQNKADITVENANDGVCFTITLQRIQHVTA